MAMFLCTAEALRWLGAQKNNSDLVSAGDDIERAVRNLLVAGEPLTYDLVGQDRAASMSAVASAIIESLLS